GKRPVPFRTRKLSPSAPMVLHSRGCGRVGRRRTQTTIFGLHRIGGAQKFFSAESPLRTRFRGRLGSEERCGVGGRASRAGGELRQIVGGELTPGPPVRGRSAVPRGWNGDFRTRR